MADSNSRLSMMTILKIVRFFWFSWRAALSLLIKSLFIFLAFNLCLGCSEKKESKTNLTTITVTKQANADTLYLNGTIEPIKIISVIAPFDGTVSQKRFDY